MTIKITRADAIVSATDGIVTRVWDCKTETLAVALEDTLSHDQDAAERWFRPEPWYAPPKKRKAD